MKKLKQMQLMLYTTAITALFFLPACVDKDYDLDDDNLDKNGVWSPFGINVPLGRVDSIVVYNELKNQFTGTNNEFFYDPDGTMYVQYSGDFNIEIPKIDAPEIAPILVDANVTLPMGGSIPLPANQNVDITDGNTAYQMGAPNYSGEGWFITIDSIGFATCDIVITVSFSGILFENSGSGVLNLSLTLPPDIILPAGTANPIQKTVNIKDFTGNKYTLPAIKVVGYNYNKDTKFQYNVTMSTGKDGMTVRTSSGDFAFNMTLETKNIVPAVFKAKADVNQMISGGINDFNTFFDSFDDDIFNFYNPAMGVELNTNIGVNFNLDVTNLTATNKTGGKEVVTGPSLPIKKPSPINVTNFEDTKYWLSSHNENVPANTSWKSMDISKLINYRPYSIDYNLLLKSTDNNSILFFRGMEATGKYTMKLPFSFTNLYLTISDTIRDVFSEDMYENFFEKSSANDSLVIIADAIDISFKQAAENSVELSLEPKILDENGNILNNVGITVSPTTVKNGSDKNLRIKITGLKNLKDAKHLSLSFMAKGGTTATPLKLTKDDYIQIKKLKFKMSGGYHFEF